MEIDFNLIESGDGLITNEKRSFLGTETPLQRNDALAKE